MKSYTDLEQSKKLAEILPIESADMKWFIPADNEGEFTEEVTFIENKSEYSLFDKVTDWNDTPYVPCWSLAALLSIIPKHIKDYNVFRIDIGDNDFAIWYDEVGYGVNNDLPNITTESPIDACVELIEKLHEQKLL